MMSTSDLNITTEQLKRVMLVAANGRIDSSNASELDSALKEAIEAGNSGIIVNLSGVEYMSSAGLRALVSALRECKKRRGDLVISQPSPRVSEVLELAGLSTGPNPLFSVYENDASAVGSF
ncbi:MAG: STAS domain-containing protein [Candidatus Promineifilaceae bacterium]|jgi:anti-sigma B factor antagonist